MNYSSQSTENFDFAVPIASLCKLSVQKELKRSLTRVKGTERINKDIRYDPRHDTLKQLIMS